MYQFSGHFYQYHRLNTFTQMIRVYNTDQLHRSTYLTSLFGCPRSSSGMLYEFMIFTLKSGFLLGFLILVTVTRMCSVMYAGNLGVIFQYICSPYTIIHHLVLLIFFMGWGAEIAQLCILLSLPCLNPWFPNLDTRVLLVYTPVLIKFILHNLTGVMLFL